VSYFIAVNSGGEVKAGDGRTNHAPPNGRIVYFNKPVTDCAYAATLAHVPGGAIVDPKPGSTITVAAAGDGGVLVRTWDPEFGAVNVPFHLLVAC
jgi:hypothetical protein